MTRTYRTTVRGRFNDLGDAQRRELRAVQNAHDMFSARFTSEGTFLYTPELVTYQHRFEIIVEEESPEDAEVLAHLRAEELVKADLERRGLCGTVVDISSVCVEDVKLRRGVSR